MSAQTSPDAPRGSRAQTNTVVWAAISAVGVLLASAVLLIALSMLSWATDRPVGSTVGSASKVALQAWYLAHSVSLPVAWGSLSVPPLLVTGFIALLFYRSGRGAVRACGLRTPLQVAEALAAVVITYVTCAVLLSSIAYSTDPMLSIWDIVIGSGTLALAASLAGMLRESGLGARLIAALPGPSYAYARGALAACWALGGMSALAVAASLIINYSETSALTAALSPTGLGGLTVIGISIAYLPNAMLLATALGTGAGFSLGGGSLYSLGTVDREALPIFPLFAALPHSAGGLALLTVLVPLAAAVVGALTMTRHLEPEHRTVSNLLFGSVMCSVLSAVAVLGVALYAAGGLGDGRLSDVGAAPVRLALWLAVWLVIAVPITAYVATRRSLKPISVARREKALSVLESGEKREGAESDGESTVDGADAEAGQGSAKKSAGSGAKSAKSGSKTAGAKSGATTADGKAGKAGTTTESADATSAEAGTDSAEAGTPDASNSGASGAKTGPVITSKLAMRRLTRTAERNAKARNAKARNAKARDTASKDQASDTKNQVSDPKSATAPAASLSVVKRARAGSASTSTKSAKTSADKATGPSTEPEKASATTTDGKAASPSTKPEKTAADKSAEPSTEPEPPETK